MSGELSELRIASARFESDSKDASITLDTYKDKVTELQRDIEEQRAKLEEMKKFQSREKEEEKEKRKQDMLSEMMSKIDMVSSSLQSRPKKLISGKGGSYVRLLGREASSSPQGHGCQ